ncbi:hypothetical protein GF407_05685 [candidate division KSB1 bacterium]|nr:hypothetical protein [candidate division KSB1 bacterium]
MNISLFTLLHFILPGILLSVSLLFCQDSTWMELDDGLWFGSFNLPPGYALEDAKLNIIRIDPEKYAFKLLCAAEKDHNNLPIKKWSEAALGQDRHGHIMFIFCQTPLSMVEFNHILPDLPINLRCAQHLEGGPEASLYLSCESIQLSLSGIFETGFFETYKNDRFWPLPNILGVVKKINSDNKK